MEDKLRILTDYNGGMPIVDILERYGIKSKATLYRILKAVVKGGAESAEEENN